jgi:L-alanine-DL-glutamate epimerase-like enolase superfamily enzyme
VPKDGYLALTTGPGLGLDIDEEALARFSYQQFPPRRIRQPEDEGP